MHRLDTITVFTANQPRHVHLLNRLAEIAGTVFAVQECRTLFPGEIPHFYRQSEVMREYFTHVIEAEKQVFGGVPFCAANVRSLAVMLGDLNHMALQDLQPALHSDAYVVFGSDFIKGELGTFLESRKALNIHMGVSPYYRGSSANFWAMFDGKPEMVGATIHYLSSELDSGPVLFHALPVAAEYEAFELGMRAVKVAHDAVIHHLCSPDIATSVRQDRSREIRCTRMRDFTDEVARDYLSNLPDQRHIHERLRARDPSCYVNPVIC